MNERHSPISRRSVIYSQAQPLYQASYPKGRVYRKASEGLEYTTTGSKALAGGRRVHVLVAISYNGGIVLAEQYEKMTGNVFADFIRCRLLRAFIDACMQSRRGRMAKMILMDNDLIKTL